jgi:hypothetical protein
MKSTGTPGGRHGLEEASDGSASPVGEKAGKAGEADPDKEPCDLYFRFSFSRWDPTGRPSVSPEDDYIVIAVQTLLESLDEFET